jgi:hypothetical protein
MVGLIGSVHGLEHKFDQSAGPLGSLVAANQELADQDLDQLAGPAVAADTVRLEQLLSSLYGQWLRRLAAVDARGDAGADRDEQALSTASWLRNRLRLGDGAARSAVRTARALFAGPFTQTAAALVTGEISPAHAAVVADGARKLPDHVKVDADPVLAELARRVDPPQLRRAVEHLHLVADPEGANREAERRHERRGVWLSPTWDGMVALKGLLDPEAGHIVQAALEPLARPADAHDGREGSQRTADALTELCRRSLEGGELPKTGGVRPQLLVTVDLGSLLGDPGGWVGRPGGPPGPWPRRHADGWLVTRPSPGSWSTASDQTPTLALAAAAATTTRAATSTSRSGCGPPWPCSPRTWRPTQPTPGRRPGHPGRAARPA